MTFADLGNYCLALAVLAGGVGILAAIAGVRLETPSAVRLARRALHALTVLMLIAATALLYSIICNDFRLDYVAGYSQRAMPLGYKIAAFWAGQEGSLLLWGLILAVMSSIALIGGRRETAERQAPVIAILSVVCGFFAALMLFAANPFQLGDVVPADGRGMNPLLQDPAMVWHPPLLFLGYAGFTIPFALVLGALVSARPAASAAARARGAGRKDSPRGPVGGRAVALDYASGGPPLVYDPSLRRLRRWVLVSWLFLGVGILLGAEWAYVELGWGGYWAWDPVENASLLPWLTATGLLHSLIAQQRRGIMKGWNVSLAVLTFLLCIFGTYLTRSGIISSVHAFPESAVGQFFLFFLVLILLISVGVILWRVRLLLPSPRAQAVAIPAGLQGPRPEPSGVEPGEDAPVVGAMPMQRLLSREGAFLLANVLLLVMMLATMVGTMYPLLSKPFSPDPVTLGKPYYNKVVVPMGLLLAALMGAGPVLAFGRPMKDARQRLIVGVLGAAAVCIVSILVQARDPWMLATAAIAGFVVAGVMTEMLLPIIRGMKQEGASPVLAVGRAVRANFRRYGGLLVHLSVAMMCLGIAGSSLYATSQEISLHPGESATIAGYTLTLTEEPRQVEGANYTAMEASLALADSRGPLAVLRPQLRAYNRWEQRNSEIAIRSTLRDDVYLVLNGRGPDGGTAIEAFVNPLVSWIWIGGLMLAIGTLLALVPRWTRAAEATVASASPLQAQATPADSPARQARRRRKGGR